ncbi:MAG: hypothetical protein ACU83N_15935, partial [Gammaproteobacteria bacterium]
MKIVFVSYPKSGRTWMRYIFHLLNVEIDFTHAGYGSKRAKLLKQNPFIGLDLKRLGDKNIFMHRNPLDTAVSHYFQIHKHELHGFKKKLKTDYIISALSGKLPPKDIEKYVLHPAFGIENVCKFNRAWLDYFKTLPDGLVLSYEDAQNDIGSV